MKQTKVISFKNEPGRLPLFQTMTIYLICDKFHVSPLIWGIVITFMILIWLGVIWTMWHEEAVDIFKDQK